MAGSAELEDFLWVGTGEKRLFGEVGRREKYEVEVLMPWLLETMTRLHRERMVAEKKNGCDCTTVETWQSLAWYLTDQGIVFSPAYVAGDQAGAEPGLPVPAQRAPASCAQQEWRLLPWSVVREHRGVLKGELP